MDLTVVVPAYNAETTIERCVEGILSQEGVDLELIAIDDGSPDDTGALLDAMAAKDARLHVVHQPNRGRSAARNVGIEAAHGTWVAFCDADDYYLPGAFERLLSLPQEGVSALWGGYSFSMREEGPFEMTLAVDPRAILNSIILVDLRAQQAQGGYSLSFDGISDHSPCFKLYRKSLLDSFGIRFREELRYSEDAIFNVEYLAAAEGKVTISSAPMYWYDLDSCQTWVAFKEENASVLPVFAETVRPILYSAAEKALCTEEDAERFIGYVAQTLFWNAIYKGPSAKETARIVGPAMRDERVWGAWKIYKPNYPRRRLMKAVQQWLIAHGCMRGAIALGRLVHGV